MNDTFDSLFKKTINIEKGYQAHKKDRGNFVDGKLVGTKYGIAAPTLKNYLGRTPTAKEMKELDIETAKEIYKKEYFSRYGVDKIQDPALQASVFDMLVNAGPEAIKILQRQAGVAADGRIGEKTVEALKNVSAQDYNRARRSYYQDIVTKNPSQEVFLKGWLDRVSLFDPKPKQVASAQPMQFAALDTGTMSDAMPSYGYVDPNIKPLGTVVQEEEMSALERDFRNRAAQARGEQPRYQNLDYNPNFLQGIADWMLPK